MAPSPYASRRPARRSTRSLAALLVASAARPGAAQNASPSAPFAPFAPIIAWHAPAGCPDATRVRAAIDALERGSDRARSPGQLAFRADVASTSAGFRVEIAIESPTAKDTKTLEAPGCDALADAFALVVVYAMDMADAEPPPRASSPSPEPSPPEPPPPDARPATTRAPAPWSVGPAAAANIGLWPSATLGVGAVGAWGERPRWELSVWWWPRRSSDLPPEGGAGSVAVELLAARVAACAPWPATSPLALCGGLEAGRMSGDAVSIRTPSEGSALYLGASAGPAVHLRLASALGLRIRLDLGVPFLRPHFTVGNLDTGQTVDAFRVGAAYGMLSIEPELSFFSTDEAPARHHR